MTLFSFCGIFGQTFLDFGLRTLGSAEIPDIMAIRLDQGRRHDSTILISAG